MAEPDRRVRRTRRSLHEALIALILERGYDHVTVQDILDRADIGRSTFYAHFRDKEALLLSSFDDLRADLRRDIDAAAAGQAPLDPVRPSSALFGHAYAHRQVYRALCGRQGGTTVHRHLHDVIGSLLREHLTPQLGTAGSDLPAELVSEFCTSALLGLLTWWVDKDFRHSPAQMARAYGRLTAPSLRAALDHRP